MIWLLNIDRAMVRRSLVITLLCAAVAAAGCDRGGEDADQAADAGDDAAREAPVPVDVAPVVAADMRRTVAGSTTLEARAQVTVVAEVAGRVVSVAVDEGATVVVGDEIAQISNDEAALAIREAQQALTRQERQLEAYRPLYESGYLARQVFEETEYLRDSAALSLERARRVQSDQRVRAPIAGAVVRRVAEVGDVVMPNQALVEIASTDTLDAVISVPERELATLREGQRAEIAIEALGDVVVSGEVTRIHPVVDPQTGTVRVRVSLDTAELAADTPALRPGMFATVRVVTDVRPQVPAVPKRALMYEAEVPWVFVLRGRDAEAEGSGEGAEEVWTVERVRLELGYDDVTNAQVLSGLEIGDRVVVAGQSGLDADARVAIAAREDAAP